MWIRILLLTGHRLDKVRRMKHTEITPDGIWTLPEPGEKGNIGTGARFSTQTDRVPPCALMGRLRAEKLRDSRYLEDGELVSKAFQQKAAFGRLKAVGLQQFRCLRVLHDRLSGKNRAGAGKSLDPSSNVHGVAKIVRAVVQHYRKAGSFVDANL